MSEREIFLQALDIQDRGQRAAFLDGACRNQPALRAAVDQLLEAHEQAGTFIAKSPPVLAAAAEETKDSDAHAGQIVAGKYKLLQQIGEGGMGSVWMADQTEPVKRRVAVKLIGSERGNSKSILSRFEAERQAIALMDHPHIAKLLDAGSTGGERGGCPFFVMELVKGVPLTEFCDEHKLGIPERLNVFMQICSAVQHAHQKGIIHRDLKPTNILVELHDDKPVPKVIDFGLAKALSGQPLSEHTLFTGFGTVAGTLQYMAPEQAKFNAIDIDTRADIYALGVILYELLTGSTPIQRAALKQAALDEVLRLVRESEPQMPSKRLSTAQTKPSVAANRHTEPQKLGRFVKGELDWIVMKALAKERDRRYETANGLARDIERFLNHEPVLAGPPSASYRLRKFVQRNRGQVVAAAFVLLALVAGIAGTTWGMIRAVRAQQAEAARAEGERVAKLDAEAANQQAQKRLAQLEKGNEIITSIFADFDVRKVQKTGEPLAAVLARRLEQAAGQLEGEAVGDPLVVAGLQNRLGLSLSNLGHPQSAIPLFDKSRETRRVRLGADNPETLQSMHDLGRAYFEAGKLDLAVPLLEETLKLRTVKLGADHPDTLRSMSNLAATYMSCDKLDLALPLFEQALKLRQARLGPDHPDTLSAMSNLAVAYENAGKPDLALKMKLEALNLRKARLGADHPETLVSMHNLAVTYATAGKWNLALPLYEETLRRRKATLGADHPDTLSTMHNLAAAYAFSGQLGRAVELCEETLKLKKAALGPEHPDTLAAMDNLAELYSDAGKWGLAQPLYEEGLRLMRAKLGDNNPVTLDTSQGLAELYLKQATHQVWFNRRKAYAESCQRALELAKNSSDPTTLERAAKICSLCPDADPPRVADAVALARKAVELGKHHGNLHWFQTALGISEFRAGHLAQSDAALGAAMKGGIENPHIWTTCAFYRSMALFHLGKNAEARKLAAEATSKMQAVRPFPRQQKTTYGHDDLVLWMAYKEAVHLLHLDSLAPEKLADDSEAAESLQNLAEVHLAAAASQAWSGQVKEYAETCRRALELAKGSEDPTTLERVSKACLLRPGNDAAVLATSLSFARKAVDRGKGHPYAHFFLMSLGMAEFRSGHWAEADSAFVAAMKDVSDTSHIWLTSTFYRAMTLFRQGKSDEARKLANEAQSIMKPLPRDDEEDLGHDDLIVWMAYKEAKDLLKLETTSPSSAQRVGK